MLIKYADAEERAVVYLELDAKVRKTQVVR